MVTGKGSSFSAADERAGIGWRATDLELVLQSNDITHIISNLGPTKEQPKGPFGDIIESFADGLSGKGKQINKTLDSLSTALTTLDEGRGDFFAVLHSLALFVNALHQDDRQFVALNKDLAQFTNN